jgi:hypothetical protein
MLDLVRLPDKTDVLGARSQMRLAEWGAPNGKLFRNVNGRVLRQNHAR